MKLDLRPSAYQVQIHFLRLTLLAPELNPSARRCLPRFFTRDFNF
jgi:hypothetical protein